MIRNIQANVKVFLAGGRGGEGQRGGGGEQFHISTVLSLKYKSTDADSHLVDRDGGIPSWACLAPSSDLPEILVRPSSAPHSVTSSRLGPAVVTSSPAVVRSSCPAVAAAGPPSSLAVISFLAAAAAAAVVAVVEVWTSSAAAVSSCPAGLVVAAVVAGGKSSWVAAVAAGMGQTAVGRTWAVAVRSSWLATGMSSLSPSAAARKTMSGFGLSWD